MIMTMMNKNKKIVVVLAGMPHGDEHEEGDEDDDGGGGGGGGCFQSSKKSTIFSYSSVLFLRFWIFLPLLIPPMNTPPSICQYCTGSVDDWIVDNEE